ncbi:MAG: PAS domain-containing protein [bacterium]
MNYPIIFLCIQTIILWFLVIFFHRQKERFTIIPLYALLAILTIFTHNLSDLGFAITVNNWYFLIGSFSFFTSLMLGVLFIYLFEGPRATRFALLVILFTSFLYIGIVFILKIEVNTINWFPINYEHLVTYFWSIFAIIIDIFFIAVVWELLGKIKKIPLLLQIFLVIFGTFLIDAIIFVTGVFGGKIIYWSVLWGDLSVRIILALIATPIVDLYLKSEKYNENARLKPKNFWEILNFHSDLESKIETMEEMFKHQKKLENELKNSEERYYLALEGANAGIWDWDITKNRIMYSSKFCSLLGFEKGELKDTIEAFKSMLHPDDAEKTFDLIDECLNNKKTYSIEYRLKTKNGQYKWYLSSGVTKFDSSDKPIRMVGSIIDINDKKIISQSYEEKVQELEQFNKLMVNREIKMAELKEEIKTLKGEKI